jgi:hypothetical protein
MRNKEKTQKIVVTFVALLFVVSALGYLFAPSKMLSIVGIVSNPQMDFLVRTLSVALLALFPSTWTARYRDNTPTQCAVLIGLAGYMFLSSAVDLQAFMSDIVGVASVPSIIFRILLGGVIVWLIPRNEPLK